MGGYGLHVFGGRLALVAGLTLMIFGSSVCAGETLPVAAPTSVPDVPRVVERQAVLLAPGAGAVDVVLMRRRQPGESLLGPSLVSDGELEVRRGDVILYSSAQRHPGKFVPGFALRDLAGDRFAEIVVWLTTSVGDTRRTCARVLQWQGDALHENAADELCHEEHPRRYMLWVESAEGSLALVAQPSPKNQEPCTVYMGSMCWFDYVVYKWDPQRSVFTLRQRLETREAFDADVNPLTRDLAFLARELHLPGTSGLDGPGAPPSKVGGADAMCKDTKWILLQRVAVPFFASLPPVHVSLLRSCERTGRTGMGSPHYDVDLVITQGDGVRYRFWHAHDFETGDPVFAVADAITIRDVSGDGTPEVLFRSGFFAVSNYIAREHVLHASREGQQVTDVSASEFASMWENPFEWVEHGGATLAIKGQQTKPADPENTCHSCAFFADFGVWRWQPTAQRFELLRTIKSTRAHAEENSVIAELDAILAQLPPP